VNSLTEVFIASDDVSTGILKVYVVVKILVSFARSLTFTCKSYDPDAVRAVRLYILNVSVLSSLTCSVFNGKPYEIQKN
jgi:hypothetical protein